MSVTSGFFNSVNHDRLYDAEQFSSMFDGLIKDGVYQAIGEAFMVKPNPNLASSIIVGTGRAWFDHTWTLNDTQFALSISDPNAMFPRIDLVVIDVDRTENVRANSIKVVQGTMSDDPKEPMLINEEFHKQYPIARIQVPAAESASIVLADNITYLVGTERCPLVTGVLEALNLENWLAQYDAEFNTWFEGIKDIFDEDPMTAFEQMLEDLNNKIDSIIPYMPKGVFDAVVSGGTPFDITGVNILSKVWGTSNKFSTNYVYDFILPDNKIGVVYFVYDTSNTTIQKVTLHVVLLTDNGVQISDNTLSVQTDTLQAWLVDKTNTFPWHVVHIDVDTYPATVVCAYVGFGKVITATCTIQSDGTVSLTKYSDQVIQYRYDSNTAATWMGRFAKMNNGRSIGFLRVANGRSNWGKSVMSVGVGIEPTGIVTLGEAYTYSTSETGVNEGYCCASYCYAIDDIVYVEYFQDPENEPSKDQHFQFLTATNIQDISMQDNTSASAKHTFGSPIYMLDPTTLGVMYGEDSDIAKVTGKFDTMYDFKYETLSNGALTPMKYDYSTTPVSNGSVESFKCINISNSPNLISMPYVFGKNDEADGSSLYGLSTIKNISKNTEVKVNSAMGSDYSTGVTYSQATPVSSDPSLVLRCVLPYSFMYKLVDNGMYILLNSIMTCTRSNDAMYKISMQEDPLAVLIKITRKE